MASPKGSGYFAVAIGLALCAALFVSFSVDLKAVDPKLFLQGWLVFAILILVGWGAVRIKTGDPGWTIGQNTINFVVAVLAATFAIAALVIQTPAPPPTPPASTTSGSAQK